MTGHLHTFVDAARRRIEAGFYEVRGAATPANGSFTAALASRPRDAVVAELKPRSPSQGRILSSSPRALLDAYREGGAAAVSVLTDPDHFDGHPDLLDAAHATGLPVLMKDFILDTVQLRCAAHHGASAVLLIERCFDNPADRERLVDAAHAIGLEVLLEVHGEAERDRALTSAAELVGVNARDLDTLAVDVPGALLQVRAIAATGRQVLLLSGVRHRRDRSAAQAAGAAAVLVGSHLASHVDPGLALRALRRPIAKVCGITHPDDIRAAHAASADLVGFVVGADSPRAITPLRAQALRDEAHQLGTRTVLVTPHADPYEVREWCRLVRPDLVQVSGFAPEPEWVHSLGAIPTRVLAVTGPDGPAPAPESAHGLVVDTPHARGGGSGTAHDWSATARMLTSDLGRFSLVAGGLAADNAADAVRISGAWGADASSRLESSPGRKDPDAVRAFVAAVHGTDRADGADADPDAVEVTS